LSLSLSFSLSSLVKTSLSFFLCISSGRACLAVLSFLLRPCHWYSGKSDARWFEEQPIRSLDVDCVDCIRSSARQNTRHCLLSVLFDCSVNLQTCSSDLRSDIYFWLPQSPLPSLSLGLSTSLHTSL
ncbi:hypothetical protein T310_9234, partial [Rasamsonia emersonii CBS 393.64]